MPRLAKSPDAGVATSDALREQRFWTGQLYAALAGYAVVLTNLLIYVAITWTQPNRIWFLAGSLWAIAVAIGCYGLRRWIVTTPHRVAIFAIWSVASFFFVTLFALLDGGIASPTASLLILPMLYLAISYSLPATLVCGTVGLLCTAVLYWLTPGPIVYPPLILKLMVLAVAFMLAIIGSTTRDRNERELQRFQRRLENLAATDDLTGCANQRSFNAAFDTEIARAARERQPLALLLIDVNHFKAVNDQHGHMIGDEVLHQIGSVLRQSARQTDIAARPGGDEFALLAPNTDREAADTIAHRLQQKIRKRRLPGRITLSIGICAMVPDTEQAVVMRRYADLALYRAKRQGRDRIAQHGDAHEADFSDATQVRAS